MFFDRYTQRRVVALLVLLAAFALNAVAFVAVAPGSGPVPLNVCASVSSDPCTVIIEEFGSPPHSVSFNSADFVESSSANGPNYTATTTTIVTVTGGLYGDEIIVLEEGDWIADWTASQDKWLVRTCE